MFNLTDPKDLEKAGRSMGSFIAKRVEELEKDYAYLTASATDNENISKLYASMAKDQKDKADAKDNDDEDKADAKKTAESTKALAASFEAKAKADRTRAEAVKADVDALKSQAAEWGTAASIVKTTTDKDGTMHIGIGGGLEDMVRETTAALSKQALESFQTDESVKTTIKEYLLKLVRETLGDKIRPDEVRAVAPTIPAEAYGSALTPVPRAGAPDMGRHEKMNVPLEFEHLFKVDEGE